MPVKCRPHGTIQICLFSPLGKPADRAIHFACVNFFFVYSLFFLLSAKLSQCLLGGFSRSFHQIEGICVNFVDQVQFFRFLKGSCHGNQFCVVSKTQTTCDFCNFYTIWKLFCADDRSEIFFYISRDVAMATNLFARSRSISGSAGLIFTIFAPYGRYWIADDQSNLLFPIS